MSLVRKASRGAIVVRAVAFGTPDGSVWGAGLDAGVPMAVAAGGAAPVALAISWNADGPDWELSGERISLTVSPTREPPPRAEDDASSASAGDGAPKAPAGDGALDAPGDDGASEVPVATEPAPEVPVATEPAPEPTWSGRQQLCRVTGTIDGAEIDCVGVRTELTQVRPGELGSVRGFSGWISAEEAVTLLALRPVSEAHHERDLVAATVFEADGWISSHDPRLSTTYDGEGHPSRATLELWVSQGGREFPRRTAGEAAGPAVTVEADGAMLSVLPLRCHSRGNDGAGIYLLASF